MNVIQAMHARHSVRAFREEPIEQEKLVAIFEAAAQTPSWGNTQPWETFVAAGETLKRIRKVYIETPANRNGSNPETPSSMQWTETAKARQKQVMMDMRRDCGEEAMAEFLPLNRSLFHAPAVLYICMDKLLGEWSLYDVGAYSQSIMLAAVEQGLSTIAAAALASQPELLHRELKIPDNLKIIIGIAIGYADESNRLNQFRSDRVSLNENVHLSL